MMTLQEYISAHYDPGVKQQEIADDLGIGRSYLSQLLSGSRFPSSTVQVKIHYATNGIVDPNSWVTHVLPVDEPAAPDVDAESDPPP